MAKKIMTAIITLVLALTCLFASSVNSAAIGLKTKRDAGSPPPSTRRCHWYTPCGTEIVPGTGGASGNSTSPATETCRRMSIKAQEMTIKANMLMERYIGERFHDPEYVAVFDDHHFSGFPLNRFSQNSVDQALSQTDEFLVQTYQELAATAVYIDQVLLENSNFSPQLGASEFYSDFDAIAIDTCDILCTFNKLITNIRGVTIPKTVDEDIIDGMYETLGSISEDFKYLRDYIVVRDLHKYLDYVSKMFQALEATVQP